MACLALKGIACKMHMVASSCHHLVVTRSAMPVSAVLCCAVLCRVCDQGMVTQVTDVKPLASVLTYLDQDSNTEVYQEVRIARGGLSDERGVGQRCTLTWAGECCSMRGGGAAHRCRDTPCTQRLGAGCSPQPWQSTQLRHRRITSSSIVEFMRSPLGTLPCDSCVQLPAYSITHLPTHPPPCAPPPSTPPPCR
jgi:hypothetical protein